MTKASDMVAALQKNYAKRSNSFVDVNLLSDNNSPCIVTEWISTGCLALDAVMGGGLPVGRITEIFGSPSSGKSLIGAQIAAVAQSSGHTVVYIDTETAVSLPMMRRLGVDVDDLIYASPDTAEEVFDFIDTAIDIKNKIDKDGGLVVIWDSVAATSSVAEMEKEYGNIGYTTQARIISMALRKITKRFSKERVAVLFLNQTRQKLGVLYGDKIDTFGGDAIKFHASIRIALTVGAKLKVPGKKKAKVIGTITRAVAIKNKVAYPFREADLPIYFGRAIDDVQASLLWLQDNGYVTTAGSWYTLDLDGKEIRFQKSGWDVEYDKNYDAIAQLILSSNNDEANESEVGEISEDEEE